MWFQLQIGLGPGPVFEPRQRQRSVLRAPCPDNVSAHRQGSTIRAPSPDNVSAQSPRAMTTSLSGSRVGVAVCDGASDLGALRECARVCPARWARFGFGMLDALAPRGMAIPDNAGDVVVMCPAETGSWRVTPTLADCPHVTDHSGDRWRIGHALARMHRGARAAGPACASPGLPVPVWCHHAPVSRFAGLHSAVEYPGGPSTPHQAQLCLIVEDRAGSWAWLG